MFINSFVNYFLRLDLIIGPMFSGKTKFIKEKLSKEKNSILICYKDTNDFECEENHKGKENTDRKKEEKEDVE